jgi:uncharacterized protein involved in exopolysaccharide biosynthesis
MRAYWTTTAVVLAGIIALAGCGKASKDQPIEQVKAEAATMSVDDLKAKAESCKAEIAKYQKQLDDVKAKIVQLKPADVVSDAGRKLNDEVADVMKSINNLQQRLQVYIDELAKKGQDVTGFKTY